ncbi:30S ribosomal protein S6 [bacterium HR40]|nr:30S ribosomal protein S6 [bacterium HR40]
MPRYEHTFIARPDLTPQQAQGLAEQLGRAVAELGGQIGKVEYWGLKTLAYRIKKHRKGHYVHFEVEGPAKVVDELERLERINEDVLRFLTVKVERFEEGPSAVMQARSGRDERRR